MPNILIILSTHGNEGFSIPPLKTLEKKYPKNKYGYDWIIGNPKAHEKNVRFTEGDLNRLAPGNMSSKIYEERRAAELINLSSKYKFIIDIHGTDSNSGVFVLVTNPSLENLLLASSLPIKNVVIWASKESLTKGPVTQYAKCPALEIECGPKNSKEISKLLESTLERIIKNPYPKLDETMENLKNQNYFVVYGKELDVDTSKMLEFKKTKIKNEEFYPLLVNAYQKGSARKMKKIDFFDLLSY